MRTFLVTSLSFAVLALVVLGMSLNAPVVTVSEEPASQEALNTLMRDAQMSIGNQFIKGDRTQATCTEPTRACGSAGTPIGTRLCSTTGTAECSCGCYASGWLCASCTNGCSDTTGKCSATN